MTAPPLAISNFGLVTSVGLSAPSSCAAVRAKIANPTETRFACSDGDWIIGHAVELEDPWNGRAKLAGMAVLAIQEALDAIPVSQWRDIPLLLCVAEQERPGRTAGIDDALADDIRRELGAQFGAELVAKGRVSVPVALARARNLIYHHGHERVLIAATDSYLSWPTLDHFESNDRLLTAANADGFMPGEAAGALLVTRATTASALLCTGLGFSTETAVIGSGEPLRGDGLTKAIKAAVDDAGGSLANVDFRIADLSGEQYYFKEATLALSRTLRDRKERFDLWHPAECTGEIGATAGVSMLAVVDAACRKGYADGPNVLAQFANDRGERAAMTLRHGAAV